MRLDKLTLLPLLVGGFAMSLTACGDDTTTSADTGWADADADADTDADYFDSYVMGISPVFGYHGGEMTEYYYSGSESPPFVRITFYEEDYFTGYDDRYTCEWVGEILPNSLNDLALGDGIWIGWDVSFQSFGPDYTSCDNFDPEVWGDSSPTTVIETAELGLGYGPMSSEWAAEVSGAYMDYYGWSQTEYMDEYGKYFYSLYIATYVESAGGLVGFEAGSTALTYLTDDAYEIVFGDDGYSSFVEVGDGMPEGVSTSSNWYLFYAEEFLLQ